MIRIGYDRIQVCRDPATVAVVGAVSGGLSAVTGLAGAMKGGPKTPQPLPAPEAPTINQARATRYDEARQRQAKGAAANILAPKNEQNAPGAVNVSLKRLLGE